MNKNSLNIVNSVLIGGGGQNNYLNPSKIRDSKESQYRRLSKNK